MTLADERFNIYLSSSRLASYNDTHIMECISILMMSKSVVLLNTSNSLKLEGGDL